MTPAFSKTGRTNHLGVKLNKEQWRTESYPLQVIIANRRLLKWLQKDIKYYRSRNTFKHTNCTSNTELVVWTWSQYHLMVRFYDMQEPLECLSWSEVMEALVCVCVGGVSLRLRHPGHYPYESSKCLWHHFANQVRANNIYDVLFSTPLGHSHTRLMCRQTKHLSHTIHNHQL